MDRPFGLFGPMYPDRRLGSQRTARMRCWTPVRGVAGRARRTAATAAPPRLFRQRDQGVRSPSGHRRRRSCSPLPFRRDALRRRHVARAVVDVHAADSDRTRTGASGPSFAGRAPSGRRWAAPERWRTTTAPRSPTTSWRRSTTRWPGRRTDRAAPGTEQPRAVPRASLTGHRTVTSVCIAIGGSRTRRRRRSRAPRR